MLSLFFVPRTVPSGRTSRKCPFLHCNFLFLGSKAVGVSADCNRKIISKQKALDVCDLWNVTCNLVCSIANSLNWKRIKNIVAAVSIKWWLYFAQDRWLICIVHLLDLIMIWSIHAEPFYAAMLTKTMWGIQYTALCFFVQCRETSAMKATKKYCQSFGENVNIFFLFLRTLPCFLR